MPLLVSALHCKQVTYITIHQGFLRALQYLDKPAGISVPHENVMRHLVARSAHDILCVTREPDRMPRRTVDKVLEPMQGCQEARQG